MAGNLTRDLLALETRLLASPERHDAAWLDAVLADDFIEVGSSGRLYDRAGVIAALTGAAAEPGAAGRIEDFAARALAPDVALVTFQAVDSGRPHSLRSSVWRREGGAWRLVYHQGTVATG